jgi:hypothetical protein
MENSKRLIPKPVIPDDDHHEHVINYLKLNEPWIFTLPDWFDEEAISRVLPDDKGKELIAAIGVMNTKINAMESTIESKQNEIIQLQTLHNEESEEQARSLNRQFVFGILIAVIFFVLGSVLSIALGIGT